MSKKKKQIPWEVEAYIGCGACPVEHRGNCIPAGEPVPVENHFGEVPDWCPLREADIVLALDMSGLEGKG